MRSKTPQQQEDRILCAATRLFATHRFHEARMEDIAALAEVGKGTLYRYFEDKEELYLKLLDRAAKGLQQRQYEARASSECPRKQLVAVVGAIMDYFDEQPHLLDVIQHAEAMQSPDTEFAWQKSRNETVALVGDILRAGEAAGLFASSDELAVLVLLGGVRAVLRFGTRPRAEGIAERIVAGFVGGYGR